jgi:hypothetical protein
VECRFPRPVDSTDDKLGALAAKLWPVLLLTSRLPNAQLDIRIHIIQSHKTRQSQPPLQAISRHSQYSPSYEAVKDSNSKTATPTRFIKSGRFYLVMCSDPHQTCRSGTPRPRGRLGRPKPAARTWGVRAELRALVCGLWLEANAAADKNDKTNGLLNWLQPKEEDLEEPQEVANRKDVELTAKRTENGKNSGSDDDMVSRKERRLRWN